MNSLKNRIRNFVRSEDGLVTVEWVALTAGMVVAAVAIGYIVMTNTGEEAINVGGGIGSEITSTFTDTASGFANKIGASVP
jgi:Flp pilus assembly pilin Flp